MRNLQKKGDLERAAAGTLNKTLFIQELDVSKEESIEKFVKATYDSEGRIDVLSMCYLKIKILSIVHLLLTSDVPKHAYFRVPSYFSSLNAMVLGISEVNEKVFVVPAVAIYALSTVF